MKPELGREYLQPNEEKDIQAITEAIIRRLKRDYPPGKILRQFHAKMHGCVQATFTVEEDLPSNLQYGIFKPGKSYEAWIRYSNGNTKVVDDKKADLRGMAIKLINVDGEMLMNDPVLPQSQDFLLVSYPKLMAPDVAVFRRTIQALCGGLSSMILFGLKPVNWPILIRTLQSMKKCANLFSLKYYSVAPYRLGKKEQAVKYAAFPAMVPLSKTAEKGNANFLRTAMQHELNERDFVFDFMIQMQEDPEAQPIENACVEWKTAWKKVATVRIEKQVFDTNERNQFCEHLSFSPWHCLKEHEPLGGVSRARKVVYDIISSFRLRNNDKLRNAQVEQMH